MYVRHTPFLRAPACVCVCVCESVSEILFDTFIATRCLSLRFKLKLYLYAETSVKTAQTAAYGPERGNADNIVGAAFIGADERAARVTLASAPAFWAES